MSTVILLMVYSIHANSFLFNSYALIFSCPPLSLSPSLNPYLHYYLYHSPLSLSASIAILVFISISISISTYFFISCIGISVHSPGIPVKSTFISDKILLLFLFLFHFIHTIHIHRLSPLILLPLHLFLIHFAFIRSTSPLIRFNLPHPFHPFPSFLPSNIPVTYIPTMCLYSYISSFIFQTSLVNDICLVSGQKYDQQLKELLSPSTTNLKARMFDVHEE